VSHNSELTVGGRATFGFQGTAGGTVAKPSTFTLNGTDCATV
jgi:hypothetical protein